MRRLAIWITALPVIVAVAFVMPVAAGAASAVPGLASCSPGPGCHYGPLHNSYPNYANVCAHQDCAFVAAANLIQITTGVTTSVASLKADYVQAGEKPGDRLSVTALWGYWTRSSIDGVYARSENIDATDQRDLEREVRGDGGLIVKVGLVSGSYVGTTRLRPGVAIMVVDGFTPKGPLVVYQSRTIQMTWAQWRDEVAGLWHATTSWSPVSPPAPTATLTLSAATVPDSGATVTLTYSSTNATTCTLSSSPALWASSAATTACNGTYHVTIIPATTTQQWIMTFAVANANGASISAVQVLTQASSTAPGAANVSTNWSGYVVPSSAALITEVQGSFTVPTLNCTDSAVAGVADVATWVGIGGVPWSATTNSGSLLQTGVASECAFGAQVDAGWFELYPSTPNYSTDYSEFPVSPGDQMQASVYETTTGQWMTQLNDVNTGQSGVMETGGTFGVGPTSTIDSTGWTDQGSAANLSYSGGYSAEWIVEDPGDGATSALTPFANFGSVTWADLGCSLTSWSLDQQETTAMVQSGLTLATPTAVSADGFTDSYTGP